MLLKWNKFNYWLGMLIGLIFIVLLNMTPADIDRNHSVSRKNPASVWTFLSIWYYINKEKEENLGERTHIPLDHIAESIGNETQMNYGLSRKKSACAFVFVTALSFKM